MKTGEKSPRISNKKAFFHFEIGEKFVAGIALLGAEVKSLRGGRGSLSGAFVVVKNGEVFVKNFHIPPWEFAREKIDPDRERKLLLKKREIQKITRALAEKGRTIVPLAVFFSRGLAKIEIALARGKKKFDKRATLKSRDEKRHLDAKIKMFRGKI